MKHSTLKYSRASSVANPQYRGGFQLLWTHSILFKYILNSWKYIHMELKGNEFLVYWHEKSIKIKDFRDIKKNLPINYQLALNGNHELIL